MQKVLGVTALVLLPVALAGFLTQAIYSGASEGVADFEHRFERGFISGFQGNEYDVSRGYRWTAGSAYVRFENLPETGALEVEVRLASPRPVGQALPTIWITANGETVFRTIGRSTLESYRFLVPLCSTFLNLGIHSDTFYVSGYGTVGVRVHSVRIRCQKDCLSPVGPIFWMMVAAFLLVGAGIAAGLTLRITSMVVSVLSLGFIHLLVQDSVKFQAYPQQLAFLAGFVLVSACFVRCLLSLAEWVGPAEKVTLTAIVAGSLLLKFGGLFYPLFISSDAAFQSNRLQDVIAGNLFTTSVTQHDSPFRIPYPVSLYVLAAPWVASGLNGVRVLQVMTAFSDVGVGLALFFLAGRFWNDPRAGILAAVLYQMVPMNFLDC